jgi:hypothetical protein
VGKSDVDKSKTAGLVFVIALVAGGTILVAGAFGYWMPVVLR